LKEHELSKAPSVHTNEDEEDEDEDEEDDEEDAEDMERGRVKVCINLYKFQLIYMLAYWILCWQNL